MAAATFCGRVRGQERQFAVAMAVDAKLPDRSLGQFGAIFLGFQHFYAVPLHLG